MLNLTLQTRFYFLVLILFTLTACSSIQSNQITNSLDAKLLQTRVVLVGETHTNFGHHHNQLDVIRKAHEKWGGVISIGLEMVQQPFQIYLDDYVSGQITESEMLRVVEWYSRWRYDFRLYRPIFDYAKQHKISLIALNIPQELTRKISRVGIATLSKEERKQLPEFVDKSNENYTAHLRKIFGMHAHGKVFNEEGFKRFVEAQLAWDEGMAFAASKYLMKNPNHRMVILAGSGHLINRDGIPSRIDRQLKLKQEQRSLVILSHENEKYTNKEADISLATKDNKLTPAGLIGIGMVDSSQGVKVSKIVEIGAAQKAGLLKGDVIIKINQTAIKTSSDVNLWRLDKKPNDKAEIVIRRNQKIQTKNLILGG